MSGSESSFDLARVRSSFDRAASTYEQAAVLQNEIARRLVEALDLVKLDARRILDAGCGTGESYRPLQKRYPKAGIVALDIAEAMLLQTRAKGSLFNKPDCVCAQLERLPFADDSFDLVFSNLAIQWCSHLPDALAEMHRVLKPGGLVMFTSFGPDTLKELRASWQSVDDAVHVNSFIDMHDVGDMLLAAGFSDPVMQAEQMVVNYDSATLLMQDLRDIGANVTADGHQQGLVTPAKLARVIKSYEQFRTDDGLPASYEVVYGHAWKPDRSIAQNPQTIPVDFSR